MVYLSMSARSSNREQENLRRRHHNKHKIRLDIQQRLLELRRLDLRAPHPRLARPQPLHSRHLFLRRQKPRRHRRARKRKAPQPKQKRQPARQQINVLPRLEPAPLDLRKPVVERPTDNGEQPGTAEPPALAQRLLLLRVEARDDAHEARGDDALDEAEEEALHVEPLVRHDAGRRHADGGPDDDDGAEDAAKVEALQGKGHGVQAGEHAKVEEGRRPREARGVDGGGRGGPVRHRELEVACHAEEDGGAQDGFVVVYQAIWEAMVSRVVRKGGGGRDVQPKTMAGIRNQSVFLTARATTTGLTSWERSPTMAMASSFARELTEETLASLALRFFSTSGAIGPPSGCAMIN